ncbi:related to nitrogen assimilation transcription factor nit-4 [Moesziomyces antarcticus]|uniref:Related to nitrogen assimilation transcription factor nit-4 n=1 Tax=Pseudozyma antarctica TaxID=84753 RepID=A0A5C3FTR9_PSEA2|nr:related to nitrogen assimilation transcription factor nit-4 [Moesziomyces antarcticus]
MPATRRADETRTTHRRQPAVSTACDFCRRRKLEERIASIHNEPSRNPSTSSPHQPRRSSSASALVSPSSLAQTQPSSADNVQTEHNPGRARISTADANAEPHSQHASHSRTHRSVGGAGNIRGSEPVATPSRHTPSVRDDHGSTISSPHGSRARSSASLSPSPTSPTSSAVATIIADLSKSAGPHTAHDRSIQPQARPASQPPRPHNHATRAVMSNLRVNNRGESRYHGPTSASFSAPEQSARDHHPSDSQLAPEPARSTPLAADFNSADNRGCHVQINPALLKDRLTTLAAHERQQEVMNVVSGKLDFDGVEPELALHLLNLHWNRQHHAYLVTYRPLFMRDMAAPPAKAKYFSKLLFHAILFGAAKFSDRIDQVRSDVNDPSTAGLQFLERVQQLLPEALIKSRITTVQALLLLACTHYARGSESAAWLHSGLAFRMAIDLGMNEDSIELVTSGTMTLEELELRRRVVWAAYVIDKIHSLYQGRQASIERRNLYVPIEFYDHFEETEFWTPVAYHRPSDDVAETRDAARTAAASPAGYTGPIYSVSTFAELCRLTVIMEKIIHLFYSIDSGTRPERVQTERLIGMRAELASWRSALPVNLRIDSISPSLGRTGAMPRSRTRPPNLISLHALYHALTILLNRPFLPHGHLRSDDPATGRSAWKACVDAASSISSLMNLYRQTVSMKGAPQLISYINFCAAGIHVRLAAQLQQRAPTAGSGDAADVAASSRRYELKALRQCLQDFEENQDPNPGVVKAKSVIRNMAERAGILDLLNAADEEGGLSPVGQGDSPPMHLSGAGNGASNGRNGHEAGGALLGSGGGMDVTHSSAQNTGTVVDSPSGATGMLGRTSSARAQPSTFGVTPPYEIDFESILASFDQFEAAGATGHDGLFAGNSDAATNSDILFGFLRDYDPSYPSSHAI